jgi:hypothetical protein
MLVEDGGAIGQAARLDSFRVPDPAERLAKNI